MTLFRQAQTDELNEEELQQFARKPEGCEKQPKTTVGVETKQVQTDTVESGENQSKCRVVVSTEHKDVQTCNSFEEEERSELSPNRESPTLPLSPPVQDNLVARVLLEHAGYDPHYNPQYDLRASHF